MNIHFEPFFRFVDLAVRSGGPEILLHQGRPVWKDLRRPGSWGVVSVFSPTGSLVGFRPVPGSAALVFFFRFLLLLFFIFCTHADLAMHQLDSEFFFCHVPMKMNNPETLLNIS